VNHSVHFMQLLYCVVHELVGNYRNRFHEICIFINWATLRLELAWIWLPNAAQLIVFDLHDGRLRNRIDITRSRTKYKTPSCTTAFFLFILFRILPTSTIIGSSIITIRSVPIIPWVLIYRNRTVFIWSLGRVRLRFKKTTTMSCDQVIVNTKIRPRNYWIIMHWPWRWIDCEFFFSNKKNHLVCWSVFIYT